MSNEPANSGATSDGNWLDARLREANHCVDVTAQAVGPVAIVGAEAARRAVKDQGTKGKR